MLPIAVQVVGGVYEERCMRPAWHEVFGSGGRAASAITAIRGPGTVTLHCYADDGTLPSLEARCELEQIGRNVTQVKRLAAFDYVHGLARPSMRTHDVSVPPLCVTGPSILAFGMIEGNPVVHGRRVVYDPQSGSASVPFRANGSSADELAIVLNEGEARSLTGLPTGNVADVAYAAQLQSHSKVVIVKQGPLGAFVLDGTEQAFVPAYETSTVWKIGSGDVFSAHFASHWAADRMSALASAWEASRATAAFCETGGFPTMPLLAAFNRHPFVSSSRYQQGYRPTVYLAGPFFTLAQLWLIEQARQNLRELGLNVFSPYHDVGCGNADEVVGRDLEGIQAADLVYAVGDGLDSGTIYEVGYARALGVPVVVYSENETADSLKMMTGSNCIVCSDYVTSIYRAFWTAAAL